jgi:hypothetical protein
VIVDSGYGTHLGYFNDTDSFGPNQSWSNNYNPATDNGIFYLSDLHNYPIYDGNPVTMSYGGTPYAIYLKAVPTPSPSPAPASSSAWTVGEGFRRNLASLLGIQSEAYYWQVRTKPASGAVDTTAPAEMGVVY